MIMIQWLTLVKNQPAEKGDSLGSTFVVMPFWQHFESKEGEENKFTEDRKTGERCVFVQINCSPLPKDKNHQETRFFQH